MIVAYLINQYPKVSHSFIRREIAGLEASGIEVARFSIRSAASELVDEADKRELEKTRFLLAVGLAGLLGVATRVLLGRPARFARALALATRSGWRSERGLARHWVYLAEACLLLKWVAEAGASRVHAHFGTNSATVVMLCRALGGPPYSFTVHGPEEFDNVKAIALPEKIQRADFVVAVSSFGRSQLYRWCPPESWSRIRVARCGVEASFLNRPLVPAPDAPRLACVGRLGEQKGHFLLLEAIARLVAEGREVQLVLVGDGPLRARLERRVLDLGLGDRVAITGWATRAEIERELLAARALILPSFAEGLPVVLMEALALGRPVVSTYIAGIPELVEPGREGWLVPAGSVEALTEAGRVVLDAPREQLERMGRAGRERVARDHDAAREAAKLATWFRAAGSLPSEEAIAAPSTTSFADRSRP